MPSWFPRATASIELAGRSGISSRAAVEVGWNGTITAETASAAGVLMIAAIRTLPSAFGMTGPSIAAYSTMTVPAMPAMPQLHQGKQLAPLHLDQVWADGSGPSMPTKMCTAAPSPAAHRSRRPAQHPGKPHDARQHAQ